MNRLPLFGLLAAFALFGQVSMSNGLKTVTTAGTRVTLTAGNTVVKWATIQALSTNTGTICVGGATVLASTRNGTCLTAGQAAPLSSIWNGFPYDLGAIYIDATVNGEGVSYTYVQ